MSLRLKIPFTRVTWPQEQPKHRHGANTRRIHPTAALCKRHHTHDSTKLETRSSVYSGTLQIKKPIFSSSPSFTPLHFLFLTSCSSPCSSLSPQSAADSLLLIPTPLSPLHPRRRLITTPAAVCRAPSDEDIRCAACSRCAGDHVSLPPITEQS